MLRKYLKIFVKLILGLIVLLLLPYYYSFIYNFPEREKFNGDTFYNPYGNLGPIWLKANFHAHSVAWEGATNGKNSPEEMLTAYKNLGYDIPSISNYHTVDSTDIDNDLYTGAYEHGINLTGTHLQVVNAQRVRFTNYPLLQLTSHKQHIINELNFKNQLTVLNHPDFKMGYTVDDMRHLENYNLMEAMSRFAHSRKYWDAALTSGYPAWIVGNDDSHSALHHELGRYFNMINVNNRSQQKAMESLKTGKSYVIKSVGGIVHNKLKEMSVKGNQLAVKLKQPTDSIEVISDNGAQQKVVVDTDTLSYVIKPENSYVRVQAHQALPENETFIMIFNPIIRSKTKTFKQPENINSINWFFSIIQWLVLLLIHVVLIKVILKW